MSNPIKRKPDRSLRQSPVPKKNTRQSPRAANTQQKILRELANHQIELEAQNEELRRTRQLLEESHDRYTALYDFAPVGYLTLDRAGMIQAINLAGANLLGAPRDELIGTPFSAYQDEDTFPRLNQHLLECQRNANGATTELALKTNNGARMIVQLKSVKIQDAQYGARILTTVMNITDRKRAEKALHQSEERFRVAQDVSLEAFTILESVRDDHGKIIDFEWTYANAMAGKILKQPPEKLVGQRLLQILPGNLENRALFDRYVRIAEGGQSDEVELEYNSDGIVGWFRNMTVKLGDGVAVSFNDITEHKRAESELRERETRYRTLVEGMEAAVLIMRGAECIECNLYTLKLFGLRDRAEIIGKTPLDFAPARQPNGMDSADMVRQNSEQAIAHGSWSFEWQAFKPNGDPFMIQVNLTPFEIAGEKLFQCVAFDITERKRVEEQLRESENRYHILFEQSPDATFLLDLRGYHLDINSRGTEMLGYTREEMLGLSGRETSAQVPQSEQIIERLLAGEHIPAYERTFRKKNGEQFPVELTVNLVRDLRGNPIYIQSIARDITERKRVEAQLRASEANLSAMLENTTASIFSVDREFRLIVGNSVFRNRVLYGLNRGFVSGDNLLDYMPPQTRTLWQGYYDRALRGEQFVIETETQLTDPPHFMEYRFNPIRAPGGDITGVTVLGNDITERKRTEKELEIALTKYKTLFDVFPLGITVSDQQGNIIETNRIAEKLLGVPTEEQLQRDIDGPQWQIIRLDGTPMPADEFASVRALKENRLIENVEMGIVKSPIETTWINVTAAPIPLEGYGVIIVYGDIGARIRAEQLLRDSETRYRLLAETSGDVIWTTDLNLKLTYISPAVEQLTGFTPQRALAQSLKSAVAPGSVERARKMFTDALATAHQPPTIVGWANLAELEMQHQDGSTIWTETRLNLIRDDQGAPRAILGITRDISERKHVECALRETRDQLDAILQGIADSVSVMDAGGQLVYVNAASARAAGYPTPEAMLEAYHAGNFTAQYDLEDETGKPFPSAQLPNRIAMKGIPTPAVTLCFRDRATRERKWASVQSTPIFDASGQVQFVVSINHDVTPLKHHEQILQQRNAELAFLNHASHALNSTLDIHHVLNALLEQANELLNCSASSIWIADPADRTIVCQQATGAQAGSILGFRLGIGEGIAGWIAQNGLSIIVGDTRQDARYVQAFSKKFGRDFRSILGVPLISQNQTIGVLELLDEEPNRFRAADHLLVETLAGTATSALENARLYDQVQRELYERRRIEQQLRESEQLYRLLAENATDMIWTRDMNLRLTYLSPAVKHLRGFSVAEAMNQDLDEILTPASANQARALFNTIRAEITGRVPRERRTGSRTIELELKRKDGSTVWTESRMSLIFDGNGNPTGILGITRDISERKRIEAERAERRRAQEFATLYEMTSDLSPILDLPILLDTILRRAIDLITASAGAIYLYDPARDTFELRVQHGVPGDLSADDWREPRTSQILASRPHMARVPLIYSDELFGVLFVGHARTSESALDQSTLHLITLFAGQAAAALRNIRTFEHIRISRERSQMLAQQLLNAQEIERRAIARELHDEFGQALTSVQLSLQNIEPYLHDSDAQETLEDTMQVVERVLEQARDLSRTLRPTILDDFGLVPALRWYIERQAKRAGITVEFNADPFTARLPDNVETVCFRIAQEAITNVVRHARANHVTVELRVHAEMIELSIRDNGTGFDLLRATQDLIGGESIGLLGMKERATLLGGDVEFITAPRQGTEIRARLPVAPDAMVVERRQFERGVN